MFDGIKNFLSLVNDNWTTIAVIISLLVTLVRKIMAYLKQSEEQRIEIAKAQIRETILKLITDAEVNYDEWNKAGSVKRSQVIQEIFKEYPVLSKVVDQAELIEWIDNQINTSLKELRKIVAQQNKTETE
jgi:hypothetical protein